MDPCFYHPDREAVNTCAFCGRPLCEECTHTVSGVAYCIDCARGFGISVSEPQAVSQPESPMVEPATLSSQRSYAPAVQPVIAPPRREEWARPSAGLDPYVVGRISSGSFVIAVGASLAWLFGVYVHYPTATAVLATVFSVFLYVYGFLQIFRGFNAYRRGNRSSIAWLAAIGYLIVLLIVILRALLLALMALVFGASPYPPVEFFQSAAQFTLATNPFLFSIPAVVLDTIILWNERRNGTPVLLFVALARALVFFTVPLVAVLGWGALYAYLKKVV